MMKQGRQRVLLVDDDENVRTSLGILLEDENFEVIEAGTVAEARALIGPDCGFEFALLDRRMGKDDGTDLIPQLRASCPDAGIFILSGSPDEEELEGADGVIDKVDSPRAVLEKLEEFGKSGQ